MRKVSKRVAVGKSKAVQQQAEPDAPTELEVSARGSSEQKQVRFYLFDKEQFLIGKKSS